MRSWLGVVSADHVQIALRESVVQVCHGKRAPLARMRTGDGFVYYSPKQSMDGDVLVRQFTAVGRVTGEDIYQVEMFPGFIPFRRDVTWQEEAAPVGIATLKSALDLTRPRNWGHQLRFGLVEITLDDFQTISDAMRWAFRARA